MALCIGANTAIFSLVDQLFFRPLPFPHPRQLVLLATRVEDKGVSFVNTSQDGFEWQAVRDHATLLKSAVCGLSAGVNLASANQVVYALDERIGANLFDVLGVRPILGREFSEAEDVPNGPPVVMLSYRDSRYSNATAGARLFRDSLERIEQIPGVESAGVALAAPFTRPMNQYVPEIDGRRVGNLTELNYSTPGLFRTLGMPILRGRAITARDDDAQAPRVAVINEAFARRYLTGRPDPIGATINMANHKWTVIGMVPSVEEQNGIDSSAGPIGRFPEAYVPVSQFPGFEMANTWFSPVWIVRTRGRDPELQRKMQQALASVDPQLPFASFQTIDTLREAETARERYRAVIFSALAALALLLAAVGVYGLSAQIIAQRTREMGIRIALGATLKDVVASCATSVATVSCVAILCGVAGARSATRLLKSLIWNIDSVDLATYATVITVLAMVAGVAILIPALRLRHLDPAQILHQD